MRPIYEKDIVWCCSQNHIVTIKCPLKKPGIMVKNELDTKTFFVSWAEHDDLYGLFCSIHLSSHLHGLSLLQNSLEL